MGGDGLAIAKQHIEAARAFLAAVARVEAIAGRHASETQLDCSLADKYAAKALAVVEQAIERGGAR